MRRLAGLVWAMALVVGCYLTACSTSALNGVRIVGRDGTQAPSASTVTVTLQAPGAFSAQATTPRDVNHVHHYTIKLYDWTGSALGSLRYTHYTATGLVTQVQFTDVPPGDYKVTGEAFSSTDDSVSISESGPAESANYVTVHSDGSPPTYSTGSSLTLNIQLKHGVGDVLNLAANVLDGTGEDLAPDDPGSPTVMHDYQITKSGVTSSFVWIPRFDAYQLVNPANCGNIDRYGVEDQYRQVGYWVSTAPAAGTPGTDWTKHTFGGFYAGKYEASRADATGSAAGTATELSVRPMVVPWTSVSWDEASLVCRQYHPKAHLMSDEEWTTLAVWTMINNIQVRGNNNMGSDIQFSSVTFTADPTEPGRTLTGSGGNETSHTLTAAGVFDLHGNVVEWTADLGRSANHNNWLVNGVDTGLAAHTAADWVFGLLTGPYARYGIVVGGAPHADFGDDIMGGFNLQEGRTIRGGNYFMGTGAGLWHMIAVPRSSIAGDGGFRPCLRF